MYIYIICCDIDILECISKELVRWWQYETNVIYIYILYIYVLVNISQAVQRRRIYRSGLAGQIDSLSQNRILGMEWSFLTH